MVVCLFFFCRCNSRGLPYRRVGKKVSSGESTPSSQHPWHTSAAEARSRLYVPLPRAFYFVRWNFTIRS